jgi:hypothetical protein
MSVGRGYQPFGGYASLIARVKLIRRYHRVALAVKVTSTAHIAQLICISYPLACEQSLLVGETNCVMASLPTETALATSIRYKRLDNRNRGERTSILHPLAHRQRRHR